MKVTNAYGKEMYDQRIIYLHENPERAGFIKNPVIGNIAAPLIIYYTEEGKGLLKLVRLD